MIISPILNTVQAQYFSERNDAEKLLLRALIISLLIHLTVFTTWKLGQKEGWWRNLTFPSWMHLNPKLLMPMTPKTKALAQQPPQPSQLNFVDVDPALAEPVPPKNPKFYSANNSVAANPHPNNELLPEILGKQTKFVKTTPDIRLKPQALQPSPAADTTEAKPLPKKADAPGDLAMAKPREKAQEKNGQSDTDIGTDAQPQPVHQRPRTIDEAKAQHGMLGAKSQQKGGANRLRMDSTVDAVKTSYGDYDQQFVDAVSTRWHQLLEDRSGEGTVVVEFKLYPDGRVTDLQTVHNEVSDMLALLCMQAISDPAPYRPWPMDMRRDFPEGIRLLRFTFYYGLD